MSSSAQLCPSHYNGWADTFEIMNLYKSLLLQIISVMYLATIFQRVTNTLGMLNQTQYNLLLYPNKLLLSVLALLKDSIFFPSLFGY